MTHIVRFFLIFNLVLMSLLGMPWASHAIDVISTQDYADKLARKMSKNGPDKKTLAEYLRVCAALKLHSANDWCTVSNVNRRWIGYARSHGFLEQVDSYRKLNETPLPKKKKKSRYSQEDLYEQARQAEALEEKRLKEKGNQ